LIFNREQEEISPFTN